MKGIILWSLLLALVWRPDQAQANFYQGKTVTIISGTTAGSAYDTYARVIAQHLGKHVPGSPSFIVQNMPGGGSIVAANFVYGVAKPDGLTIASINPALYFNQLAGRKEVQFDWAKFNWLGSPDWSDHVLYMRTDTPLQDDPGCAGRLHSSQVHCDGNRHDGPLSAEAFGRNHRDEIQYHLGLSGWAGNGSGRGAQRRSSTNESSDLKEVRS